MAATFPAPSTSATPAGGRHPLGVEAAHVGFEVRPGHLGIHPQVGRHPGEEQAVVHVRRDHPHRHLPVGPHPHRRLRQRHPPVASDALRGCRAGSAWCAASTPRWPPTPPPPARPASPLAAAGVGYQAGSRGERAGQQRPQVGDALVQGQAGPDRGALREGGQRPVDVGVRGGAGAGGAAQGLVSAWPRCYAAAREAAWSARGRSLRRAVRGRATAPWRLGTSRLAVRAGPPTPARLPPRLIPQGAPATRRCPGYAGASRRR